jgi:hypothetical protein
MDLVDELLRSCRFCCSSSKEDGEKGRLSPN